MQNKFISSLLLIGLILAQLVLAQHAHDLISHVDNEPCELCLLSTGLDQALGQEHPSVELQPVHGLAGRWQHFLNLTPLTTAFLARAPPPVVLPI
ncbi:MAG: hypothetical protein OEU51_03345 [Gammaproteobacteria bacterium]|nr:hypothetical protein [Gammaproteobacteria bacterium]